MSVLPVWLIWHAFKWAVRAKDWTRHTLPVRFLSYADIVLRWQLVIIQPQKWALKDDSGLLWLGLRWSDMLWANCSSSLTWFFNRNQQLYHWPSADYVIAIKIWACGEASQHALGLTDSWTISLILSVFQYCYWSYSVQHFSPFIFTSECS